MSKKKYVPHAWESVDCPFCSYQQSKLSEKYGSELQFTYVECLDCGLIYQSPRPKYDEVFLRDAYEEYFHFDQDYTYSAKNLGQWSQELREIFKFDKHRSAILDIGSCMGDFLKVAQDYYPHCVGMDVAENMANFTVDQLGVQVHVGKYAEWNFKEKFSCIHMSHVIEHIPNPNEWVQKTRSLLDKDGILVMSIPNRNALDNRLKLFLKRIGLRKGAWKDNSRTPDHLFEPTIQSTLKFFAANGFHVLEYYTYSSKDVDASTFWGRIYNRKLKLGGSMRFFVTAA